MFAVSPNEVWAVGEAGAVIRGDATGFTQVVPPSSSNVNAVWAAGSNDVWVGGANLLARWNGTSWVSAPGFTGGVVLDIWGTSASDIWAVGGSGVTINGRTFVTLNAPALVWHFDGVTWTRTSNGTTALSKVFVSGASVWAAGFSGDLRSFDGVSWTSTTVGNAAISSLTGASGTIWLVSSGQIIRGN